MALSREAGRLPRAPADLQPGQADLAGPWPCARNRAVYRCERSPRTRPELHQDGSRHEWVFARDFLSDLYGTIKDSDEHLRFILLTGVSKLAGIFSANLMEPEFSDICGYTDAELDAVFAPELEGLDRDEVRRRYDGCS